MSWLCQMAYSPQIIKSTGWAENIACVKVMTAYLVCLVCMYVHIMCIIYVCLLVCVQCHVCMFMHV